MPDVYISRAGLESKELDEKFSTTEMSEIKVRLIRQEQENRILKDAQDKLRIENEMFRKEMEEVRDYLNTVKVTLKHIIR